MTGDRDAACGAHAAARRWAWQRPAASDSSWYTSGFTSGCQAKDPGGRQDSISADSRPSCWFGRTTSDAAGQHMLLGLFPSPMSMARWPGRSRPSITPPAPQDTGICRTASQESWNTPASQDDKSLVSVSEISGPRPFQNSPRPPTPMLPRILALRVHESPRPPCPFAWEPSSMRSHWSATPRIQPCTAPA